MSHIILRSVLAVAISASLSTAVIADDAMLKRIDMLEKQLQILKGQVSKQAPNKAVKKPKRSKKVISALKGGGKLTVGGYIKADIKHVSGDVGYQDYYRGNNPGLVNTSHTGFNVKETRLNAKFEKDGVTGFVEFDLYGGGGNEVATNSTSPRLRHAFIKYDKWLIGQYWTTFTPISAFPEGLDFGGPILGEVFIRQPQVRYTSGNFAFAIENPETWGDGDVGTNGIGGGQGAAGADPDEKMPDLVATYNFKGGWGNVQVGALIRKIDQGGLEQTAVATNVGGRIKIGAKNDLRFQVNLGESGRYVGAGMVNDLVTDTVSGNKEVESTTALYASYRHFWNNDWRSNFYYGNATGDHSDFDRSHGGINLIRQITPKMLAGAEIGNFSVNDSSGAVKGDSNYVQFSWKYTL